jgi:hypothetical protein
LHKGRRQADPVAIRARLNDAVDELEELRRSKDRAGILEAVTRFS